MKVIDETTAKVPEEATAGGRLEGPMFKRLPGLLRISRVFLGVLKIPEEATTGGRLEGPTFKRLPGFLRIACIFLGVLKVPEEATAGGRLEGPTFKRLPRFAISLWILLLSLMVLETAATSAPGLNPGRRVENPALRDKGFTFSSGTFESVLNNPALRDLPSEGKQSPPTKPQGPQATLSLDTTAIQTGERANLSVELKYRVDEGELMLQWPEIADTIPNKLEVLQQSKVDTVLVDKEEDPFLFVQRKEIQITSFDTGYLAIQPLVFIVNGDSLESNPLLLHVTEPEVMASEEFKDIKPVEEVKLDFMDYLRLYWWIPTGIVVLALLILLIRKVLIARKKKEVLPKEEVKVEPKVPAHIWALEELEKLRREELWQKGRDKVYYSRLSNILREYLERRYGIHAMEETTSQITRSLSRIGLDSEQQSKLRSGLQLADLVKFAKEKPLPQENEEAFQTVKGFVELTAGEEMSQA